LLPFRFFGVRHLLSLNLFFPFFSVVGCLNGKDFSQIVHRVPLFPPFGIPNVPFGGRGHRAFGPHKGGAGGHALFCRGAFPPLIVPKGADRAGAAFHKSRPRQGPGFLVPSGPPFHKTAEFHFILSQNRTRGILPRRDCQSVLRLNSSLDPLGHTNKFFPGVCPGLPLVFSQSPLLCKHQPPQPPRRASFTAGFLLLLSPPPGFFFPSPFWPCAEFEIRVGDVPCR